MEIAYSRLRPASHNEFASAGLPSGRRPVPHLLTSDVTAAFRQVKAFVAGILIGSSPWALAFVITAEQRDWQQYGSAGSVALFGVGVWLWATCRTHGSRGRLLIRQRFSGKAQRLPAAPECPLRPSRSDGGSARPDHCTGRTLPPGGFLMSPPNFRQNADPVTTTHRFERTANTMQ